MEKKATVKPATTRKSRNARTVIVTSQWRDLYYGEITATDEEIIRDHAVRVSRCRHIAYWKGPTGGLTSLAVSGPGPGSRIGAPCPSMLVGGVAHVLDVATEAQARFAAILP